MQKFTKTHRLLKASDFQRIFEVGKKVFTPHCIFFVGKNALEHPRLGFALSKKRVKLARQRNRIKRIVREGFRKRCDLEPVDVIMIARTGIALVSNEGLRKELENLWLIIKK